MYLDCAVFENYRNISHFPFSFDPGINILYGKNAQGKTNVIEGIYFFGNGKSFRRAREKDLIQSDKNYSQISISYVDTVRENKMSVRLFRDMSKEMFKNGVKIGRTSNFIGNFRAGQISLCETIRKILYRNTRIYALRDRSCPRYLFADI